MKKTILVLALSLSMILGLVGCAADSANTEGEQAPLGNEESAETLTPDSEGPSADIGAPAEPTTLRLTGSDVGTPNPFRHATRGPGMARMQLLYDSLLEKDENGGIPWLAKSWDVSDDGTVYTFHLQENALWHDGEPLTAEDVAFTLSYYEEHPPVLNTLLADGEYIVEGTEVIDTYTVKITLKYYDNTFLTDLGWARIIPKHIWENVDDPTTYDGDGVTIGSGPYMLERYDAAQGVYRYVASTQYWGLEPSVEAIEWVPVSDEVLAFENGEIDLINASADILSRYEDDSQYTIKTVPSLHSYRLMMNAEAVSELADVDIRKAIAHAIDRQGLVDTVARGAATISSAGYIPMDSPWYNPDIAQYDYSPEKASELLGGQTYSFTLLTDNSAEGTKTAEMIQLYLADVNIDVTVESVERKTRDNAVKTGEYELLLINSGGMGGDPDFLRDVYGEAADTIKGWSNDRGFDLLSAQAIERDAASREEMIDEAQRIIAEEVPMVMLFGAVDNFVYRQDIFDGWMCRYDHNKVDHNKLTYLTQGE